MIPLRKPQPAVPAHGSLEQALWALGKYGEFSTTDRETAQKVIEHLARHGHLYETRNTAHWTKIILID